MIILGGLGSIWGVVIGAVSLSFINSYFIPDVFNTSRRKLGLDFDLTQLSFGIFGFLIVLMMILRPEGLMPERRRKIELTEGVGVDPSAPRSPCTRCKADHRAGPRRTPSPGRPATAGCSWRPASRRPSADWWP